MKKKGTWIYLVVFALLTLMTWSPLGYGSYGSAKRFFGMPDWAVIALLAATVLFVLQWYFLFFSGLALDEEEMDETLTSLKNISEDAESVAVSRKDNWR
jgi:uncharacterized membrane protein YhdT